MRDILFRGKAKFADQWVYGDLTHYGDDGAQIWPRDENAERWNYVVDPNTVGQFTGLYDKNGTKIFEGDIIKSSCDFDDPEDYVIELIVFEHCAWCTRQVGASDSDPRDDGDFEKFGVVIGNVYDNPELLKGGAE